jgi:hypothetical protein
VIRFLTLIALLGVAILAGYWCGYCVQSMINGAPRWAWEGAVVLGLVVILSLAVALKVLLPRKDDHA